MFQNISKNNFLNYLFCFIPISFIAGNLILNLNILALIAFTIFFNNNSIFKIKFNLFDKIVIIFFLYLLILFIIKGYSILVYDSSEKELNVFIKTLAHFRFLILYFILKFLVLREILNFKFFFIVCTGCTLFICLDMILQIYTGKDIFGLN